MDQPTLRRQVLIGTAGLVVLAQLAFRAWALYPSWFYTDDYRLLVDADASRFDASYLLRPFDSQLMPAGRLIAWVVAHAGHLDWTLAASITLVLQALATIACAWMLFTLFGVRLRSLLLLVLYAGSAITVPALMWWAASLNQLPLQIVLFVAVTCWVRYLGSRRLLWLLAVLGALVLGLLSYVKTVLVLGVLVYLLLAWFTTGSPAARVRAALRERWLAALVLGVPGIGFVVYYTTQVPQIVSAGGGLPAGPLAGTMLGTSLPVGLVGGPWRWDTRNPPTGYADPPQVAVHLAWVVLAVALLVVLLRRRGTGRAWALLAGYAVVAYVLALTSRARVAGDLIGLEYRYLTDVLPVFVLCLGLATMRLRGAEDSSAPRDRPLLTLAPGPRLQTALVVVVALSGVVSSAAYVHIWHSDNPGERYVRAAMTTLADQGRVDLADQVVPFAVIPGYSEPYNTTGRLLPLVSDRVRFPRTTGNLVVLDDQGAAHRALIDTAATSRTGPDGACGWLVKGTSRAIPMDQTTVDFSWWIRIGYLAGGPARIQVRAGDDVVPAQVRRGVNSLYLRVSGPVSRVTVTTPQGESLCVDTVEVGRPVPGGAL